MSIKIEFEKLFVELRKDQFLKIKEDGKDFLIDHHNNKQLRISLKETGNYVFVSNGLREGVPPPIVEVDFDFVYYYYNRPNEINCWDEHKPNPPESNNFEHVGFLTTEELILKVRNILSK